MSGDNWHWLEVLTTCTRRPIQFIPFKSYIAELSIMDRRPQLILIWSVTSW